MAQKINVALIGGGRTGTPLLKALLGYPFINVVGIADKNASAKSMKLAKKQGIFTTTKPMEIVDMGAEVDILIEVTGDSSLKKRIKAKLVKNKNRKTIIMHDLVARMFISICTNRKSLVADFHPHIVGVGK